MKEPIDRRTVIGGLGSLAIGGALAGCSTDSGGDGGDGGDGGNGGGDGGSFSPPSEATDYLSNVGNYDGFEDLRGQSSVTVEVGVEANGDFWGYGPPAIRVDTGTTVTWEWTGEGGSHNVLDEDGAFGSDLYSEAGQTFDYTFDSAGTSLYYCEPHESVGMKGVVITE